MVSSENIYPSNVIQTENITFKDLYVYIYMHAKTILERDYKFKRNKEGYMGVYSQRKGKEEML